MTTAGTQAQDERLRAFMKAAILKPMRELHPALADGDLMAETMYQMALVRKGALSDDAWQVAYMGLLMEGFTLGYRFRE